MAELRGHAGPGTAPQPQHPPWPLRTPRPGSAPRAPAKSRPSAGFGPQPPATNCPRPLVGIGAPAPSLRGAKRCALGRGGDQRRSRAVQAVVCKDSCLLLLPAVGSTVPRGWQCLGSGHPGSSPIASPLLGRQAVAPRRGTDPEGTCWGLDMDCGRIAVPITGMVPNRADTSGSHNVNSSKGIQSPWGFRYQQENLHVPIPTDGR